MIKFSFYVDTISSALKSMEVTDAENNPVEHENSLLEWCRLTQAVKSSGSTMYIVGNGASAMMASHMAADVSKNGEVKCLAFNDPALMTAVSNDIAYDECFAMPIKRFANTGDVLITVSSSGNSPNVIKAIEAAKELGLYAITLSGMKPDNQSRKRGDLNFYVPADTYGVVESSHQVLLHYWLDRYIEDYQ